jgi:hypothetical protein
MLSFDTSYKTTIHKMIDAANRSDEKNSIFKIQNKQPIIQEIKPVDQKNLSAKLF